MMGSSLFNRFISENTAIHSLGFFRFLDFFGTFKFKFNRYIYFRNDYNHLLLSYDNKDKKDKI